MNMKRNVPQILSKAKKEPDVSDQAPCNSPHTQHFKRLLEYRMDNNLPQHPCANKCTEFKGEQCKTCLVQQIENCEDELPIKFNEGDFVVFVDKTDKQIMKVCHSNNGHRLHVIRRGVFEMVNAKEVRYTTVAEIQANRRLTEAEQALAEVS